MNKWRRALEAAGVSFIVEAETDGPGVRLKKQAGKKRWACSGRAVAYLVHDYWLAFLLTAALALSTSDMTSVTIDTCESRLGRSLKRPGYDLVDAEASRSGV